MIYLILAVVAVGALYLAVQLRREGKEGEDDE